MARLVVPPPSGPFLDEEDTPGSTPHEGELAGLRKKLADLEARARS